MQKLIYTIFILFNVINMNSQSCATITECNELGKKALDLDQYNEAYQYYIKSADKGDLEARIAIGLIIYYDLLPKNIPIDYKKILKWFEDAEKEGNKNVSVYIGCIYSRGLVGEKNEKEALRHYEIAAENGDPSGMCNVGIIYFNNKNYKLAYENLKKSADKNHEPAKKLLKTYFTNENIYKLGSDEFNGLNLEQIMKVIKKGMIYENQIGNLDNALDRMNNAKFWFKISSANGHINSMAKLGMLLISLEGDCEGFDWLEKAKGNVEAEKFSNISLVKKYYKECKKYQDD